MAPIDFNGLDTAVHGPIRLGVLTALQMHGALDFTTLKKRLKAADGAMGMHLRNLDESGYIACTKAFIGRRPKSIYRINRAGRRALAKYLDAMQQIINAVDLSRDRS